MPSSPSLLPRAWFVTVAIATLLLALVTVGLLATRGGRPAPQSAGEAPGDPKRTSDGVRVDDTPALRQSAADGEAIPWGAVAPGMFVRLQVAGAAGRYDGADLFVAKDDGPVRKIDHPDFAADLTGLEPGRYRWSAVLRGKGGSGAALEPPRIDPHAPDFVIAPRQLELSGLRQRQLDGAPIAPDLRTMSGVRVGADVRYPDAVIEVEIKLADRPFDGTGLQRAPVADKGTAEVVFQGPDGPYRWRARASAQSSAVTAWQEFRFTPQADFVVFHPASASPPATTPPSAGPSSLPLSSALGNGPAAPLPSEVPRLPSLASLLFSPKVLAVAMATVVLSAALQWRQRKRRAR